jgi:hypothetical protein
MCRSNLGTGSAPAPSTGGGDEPTRRCAQTGDECTACIDTRGCANGDENQCGGGHERRGTSPKARHERSGATGARSAHKPSDYGDEHGSSSCDKYCCAGAEACRAVIACAPGVVDGRREG